MNDDKMNEIRSDFAKFKKRRELQEPAENAKMGVVGILIASVVIFSILGDDVVKDIIWYWAAFMTLLLIICAIWDIRIAIKIRKLGLK